MINNVTLVGRLTKDPELKYTPNGVAVANFTLACDRAFKSASGEKETDFINIVVWRKAAENLANYQKKGSQIGVTGSIQTRTYDGDKGKVYVTEVVAERVQFLDPKGAGQANNNTQSQPNTNKGYTRLDEDPFAGNGQIDISSDDLPF